MNVKELRTKKGLTQEELSEKSGIPRDRIAKWEQGKGSPKVADEKILLGIFGEQIHNASVGEPEAHYGHPTDYKDKYIESIERENKRLQKDLDASLGELRHNILMTRAISITNQHFLAELLAKQRKEDLTQVRLEINKVNGENYKKAKAEGKFADVGS